MNLLVVLIIGIESLKNADLRMPDVPMMQSRLGVPWKPANKKVPYGKEAPVYKRHHHIQAYPDFVTYPYKFQKPLLLLLGKKRFFFAGFYGIHHRIF